jgi:D-alanyl-D-alanine carboxypeptidase (penicillin-binding protein 5/6)
MTAAQTIRRRRRGGAVAAAAVTAALLAASTYAGFALLAPIDPIVPQVLDLEGVATPAAEVTLPSYGGSAIGDAESDHLYAGVDVDTPRPIASLTKVITALVVLHEYPIEPGADGATITLTAADSRLVSTYAAINGTTAPAPAGGTITQRAVIELMMVHSANNYAETLAVWAFGSVDAYLSAARGWLDEQGLTGISVADTTGFSPENRASPRSLLRLARVATADPVVAAAAALPRVAVPGIGSFENRNLIVGADGVTGLKTGTLRASGSSLLFSAEHAGPTGEHRVVGVVLNGPDGPRVAADARALLLSVRDDYHEVELVAEGAVVARYSAPWGDTAEVRTATGVNDVVWGEMASVSTVRAPELQPGVDVDDEPTLEVRYAGERVRLPLQWVGTIDEPPLDWRLAQPLNDLVAALGLD